LQPIIINSLAWLSLEVELQAKYTAAAVVTRYAETVPGTLLEELMLQDNSRTARI